MNTILFATGLQLEIKIDEVPKALFVIYSILDTDTTMGRIVSPARTVPLLVSQEDGKFIVNRVAAWIEEIKAIQKIAPKRLHEVPAEVTLIETDPKGISYNIEMGTLGQDISWDKATDEVTIAAGQAYDITFEGFIYYVGTLLDLIAAIEKEKALP